MVEQTGKQPLKQLLPETPRVAEAKPKPELSSPSPSKNYYSPSTPTSSTSTRQPATMDLDGPTERTCPGGHTTAHPAPALRDDEHLCRACVHHAERILADIPALVRDLELTITRQTRVYRAGGRAATEPEPDWRGSAHALPTTAMPVDFDAAGRGRTVLELLFEWADYVAAWHRTRGMPLFARHRPLTELAPAACAILLHRADWIRTNEQGPGLAQAIRSIRRDLRQLVDTRPERLYAGPCQADLGYDPELGYRCQLPLHRESGRDTIACDGHRPNAIAGAWTSTGCGTDHPTAARREWLRAELETQLLPLRVVWADLYELVPGFDMDWDSVKQWTRTREQRVPVKDAKGKPRTDRAGRPMVRVIVTPPRLEPQAWAGDQPLYRGADILRLAEDQGVRRGRRRRVRRAVPCLTDTSCA